MDMKSTFKFIVRLLLVFVVPINSFAEMIIELSSLEGIYVEVNENGIVKNEREEPNSVRQITKISDNGVITSTIGVDFSLSKYAVDEVGTIWLVGEAPLAVFNIVLNLSNETYIATKTYTDILSPHQPLVLSQTVGKLILK